MAVKMIKAGDAEDGVLRELEAVLADSTRCTFATAVGVFPGDDAVPPAILYERMQHSGLDVKAW